MEIVRNIKNYFTGRDIVDYYEREGDRYDFLAGLERVEKQRELEKQKSKYMVLCKTLPTILDIVGLMAGGFGGAFLVGASEAVRSSLRDDFYSKCRINSWDCELMKADHILNELKNAEI